MGILLDMRVKEQFGDQVSESAHRTALCSWEVKGAACVQHKFKKMPEVP